MQCMPFNSFDDTLSLYLSRWNLPPSAIGDSSNFQFVQVFVAGIQSPSMGRRALLKTVVILEISSNELNGKASIEAHAPLTSTRRLTASTGSTTEVAPDPFGREAKHFTEIRVLNRDVRIILEGVDKFSNLIGSVYYPDCESVKDLTLELIENLNTLRGVQA